MCRNECADNLKLEHASSILALEGFVLALSGTQRWQTMAVSVASLWTPGRLPCADH